MKSTLLHIFFLAFGLQMCSAQKAEIYTIDAKKTYQTIDNFSASDCWSVRFVGNWPDAKRNAMADYLFSMENDKNGNPKGIGLSAWRFNIGAGSADQGKNSGIKDDWRMGETFIKPDGSYDWNKLTGQRWFLRAAKQRGVNQFIGFSISPPYSMTRNGKTFGDTLKTCNIDLKRMPEYANYLTEVTKGVRAKEGIEFDYISPVNEPQWLWMETNNQEGSFFRNSEFALLVRELDKSLLANSLKSKILITEAASHDFLVEGNAQYPYNGFQIDAFWGKSPDNVSDVKSMAPIIASHDYFSTWPLAKLTLTRQKVGEKVNQYKGLKFWQTEYCILGEEGIQPWGKDLTMQTALYVARIIHFDMVLANASAWQWWLAISPCDYKDGLIYVDRNEKDGNFETSKLMWALGNFSRFVRPGAMRIDVKPQSLVNDTVAAKGLMLSAYLHPKDKKLVIVAINYSNEAKEIKLAFENLKVKEFTPYQTSDLPNNNLAKQARVKANEKISIPPQSVVTYVAETDKMP